MKNKKKVINDLSEIDKIFHKDGTADGEVWVTEIRRNELRQLPPEFVKPKIKRKNQNQK